MTRLLTVFVIVAAALFSMPATGVSFTVTGSMTSTRKMFTATMLPDGKALVAGGEGAGDTASCMIPRAVPSA